MGGLLFDSLLCTSNPERELLIQIASLLLQKKRAMDSGQGIGSALFSGSFSGRVSLARATLTSKSQSVRPNMKDEVTFRQVSS